jgi:hypothetical protein
LCAEGAHQPHESADSRQLVETPAPVRRRRPTRHPTKPTLPPLPRCVLGLRRSVRRRSLALAVPSPLTTPASYRGRSRAAPSTRSLSTYPETTTSSSTRSHQGHQKQLSCSLVRPNRRRPIRESELTRSLRQPGAPPRARGDQNHADSHGRRPRAIRHDARLAAPSSGRIRPRAFTSGSPSASVPIESG